MIIDHLPFSDGDRRLQEERRGQRSENRWNPWPRPRNFWATTKPDERRGIESKKTLKTSHEETTCSTRNHDRPVRRGKSRRKRAARNWKKGSTKRMQRFIPRDGLLPGKKNTDKKTEVELEILWRQRSLRKFQMEKQLFGVHRQNPCSQMWRMKSKSPTRSGQASIRGFQTSPWNEAGVQTPRVEDFMYCLRDCKIFTELGLRQGCNQLALDSSTRQVAIFSAPWGNYRPRRLMFGARSSQKMSLTKPWSRIFWDKQSWWSGDSTRLPPMWPGFDSVARNHMWVEFAGSLLCEGSPEYFSFPLSPKSNIWFDLIWCDFSFICNLLNW